MRWGRVALAALILAALPLLALWRAGDGARLPPLSQVAFGASYTRPDYKSAVYTRMLHAQGTYRFVLHDLESGKVQILSEDFRTVAGGACNGEDYFFLALQRNRLLRILGRIGDPVYRLIDEEGLAASGFSQHLAVPTVTPDGRFVANPGEGGVECLSLSNGERSLLVSDPEKLFFEVAFSPRFQELAVILRDSPDKTTLAVIDLKSDSPAARIIWESNPVMRPRWWSDARVLSFVDHQDGAWRLHQFDLETETSRIVYQSDRFIESAEIHPDARQALVVLGQGPTFQGYFEGLAVHLVDLESGELRDLPEMKRDPASVGQ